MSDICSPMIILLENEADAFWCFEHAMRRLVCNVYSCYSKIVVISNSYFLLSIYIYISPLFVYHRHVINSTSRITGFRNIYPSGYLGDDPKIWRFWCHRTDLKICLRILIWCAKVGEL